MSDLNYLMSMAMAHTEAAMEGKLQGIDHELAEHMGAFVEDALSPNDAFESIHDLEITHGY